MLSLFDKLWHPSLDEAEALEMMKKGERMGEGVRRQPWQAALLLQHLAACCHGRSRLC